MYAGHVEAITGCSEEDTVVVSNNPNTIECFTEYGKNYRALMTGKRVWTDEGYLCATKVRQMMADGGNWREYVPESARKVIERIGGEAIMRKAGGQYEKQPK
jgi:nicotinamide mononucleotide adenylyltransferase